MSLPRERWSDAQMCQWRDCNVIKQEPGLTVKVRREAARAALARKDIIACVAGNEIEFCCRKLSVFGGRRWRDGPRDARTLSLFADESGSKTDHEMLM